MSTAIAAPKIPNPDQILDVTNRQVSEAMDLVNSQMTEISATLGLPAFPMPKVAPPALPKLGAAIPALPTGFPTLPLPFGAGGEITPVRKGEETIKKEVAPIAGRAIILA